MAERTKFETASPGTIALAAALLGVLSLAVCFILGLVTGALVNAFELGWRLVR